MSTKDKIMDAAEVLFAQVGFNAASIRDITQDAGVNLASIHYHFGSKVGLLSAILKRRVNPINTRRLELLNGLGSDPSLQQIIRAFLQPAFHAISEMGPEKAIFMKLVARIHAEMNPSIADLLMEQFADIIAAFGQALAKALPQLDDMNLRMGFHFMVGVMVQSMQQIIHPLPMHQPFQATDELMENMIRFCEGGLIALTKKE